MKPKYEVVITSKNHKSLLMRKGRISWCRKTAMKHADDVLRGKSGIARDLITAVEIRLA